jgi:hypothetical protein
LKKKKKNWVIKWADPEAQSGSSSPSILNNNNNNNDNNNNNNKKGDLGLCGIKTWVLQVQRAKILS